MTIAAGKTLLCGAGREPIFAVSAGVSGVQERENRNARIDRRDDDGSGRVGALANSVLTELHHPEQLEAAARHVRREDMPGDVLISGEAARQSDWLAEYLELGIETLILHNVNLGQRAFIEVFGSQVIPGLARSRGAP